MFSFIVTAYHEVLYQPLLNAIVVLYNTVAFGDAGVAIILLTLLIRLVLYPVFHKGVRHQAAMQRLQPHLKKIQEKKWDDPKQQLEAIRELYKEHGTNPFSGFLLLLVQIPVIIALFQIARAILSPDIFGELYSFVDAPTEINPKFLGLINLHERSIVVVGIASILQYLQAKLSITKKASGGESAQERMMRQMALLGPGITFVAFFNFPAAVSLYWLTSSAFSLFQQYTVYREQPHGTDNPISKKIR